MEWYLKSAEQAEQDLQTSRTTGLSTEEASKRLEQHGPNKLEEAKKTPLSQKLIAQLKDPLVIILIIAAVLSALTNAGVEALIIVAVVILNAALSIYQEGKAENSVAALQKMSSPNAKVVRNGDLTSIKAEELVPGDVVVLETGDIVPADLRLFESSNLQIDESSFTGESVAAEKAANAEITQEKGIGDRENMAFSSTIVTYGHGKGIVTTTGKETEIGQIATTIQAYEDEETPLQKKLNVLSKFLGRLVIGVAAIVFVLGLIGGQDLLEIALTAISLGVAAIPEGMTAVVTIVLSIGMNRMAERNAIVKKLLSVETLGTTTVICSDKTGTLTQNEMTVTKIFTDGREIDVTGTGYAPVGDLLIDGRKVTAADSEILKTMVTIAASANDAKIVEDKEKGHITIGDPTEGALLTMASKAGVEPKELSETTPRLDEIPFDSDRKMMTTFHDNYFEDHVASFTKGAPDIIIQNCDRILIDGEEKELTDDIRQQLLDKNSEFAKQALRCLAYAYRSWETLPEKDQQTSDHVEHDMVFVGLTGMIDPPRPEAKAAIAETKSAGITTIMITGDYLETAYAIGHELGIADSPDQAMMGEELNNKSLEEVQEIVKTHRIFARVSPQNKVQIVDALKANGEITAMTGDGVNDAPAIKRADIGVSMGITGTDVAKNTANVILTDDNFATIVNAVEEGRIIYSNIKKFVTFLLSCNIGEVIVIAVAMVLDIIMAFTNTGFRFPTPLSPIMLLWLNLVTDSLPALALGMEPREDGIMQAKPRDPQEPIVGKADFKRIMVQAIAIGVATLGAFGIGYYYFGQGLDGAAKLAEGRTMAFSTLILAELFRAMAARSNVHTMNEIGWFSNKHMNRAILIGVALLLIVLYIPLLRDLFNVSFMTLKEWVPTLILSIIPFVASEGYQAVEERRASL
ncbi:MAG: cation-translocating P-type ATPase [Peptoniphilaceae bacterium]|nr:cation-translocating P-type ATPase [Peptoniphilaceae bacterium]